MRIMTTALLILAATTANADWEDVFMNPDLTVNYQGYTSTPTISVDPITTAWPQNEDLFAGHESGDVINVDTSPTSLDVLSSENPDLCGCI
ncbi:MAG: hypothetical protein ABFR19_08855 [Pseudomonadota bacterium]